MRTTEYERYKELFEQHILDFLPEVDHKSKTLHDAMKYSLTAGGKRIRPVLLLAAYEFSGGKKVMEAMPYACAIEYVHTYSLIHDDLPAMDDDELRRGQATNHKVFGEAIAILAGDGLNTAAFEAMNIDMQMYFDDTDAIKRRINASYEIAKRAGVKGMVAGQVADMESEGKTCSREMLEYIHLTKTAALIVAAIRAGARLAGAGTDILENLTIYAENLGLAFQIADDILDVCGDEMKMGKKSGMDSVKRKSTYPSLYGLEKSQERLMELTENAVNVMAPYYDNAELFTDLAKTMAVRGR